MFSVLKNIARLILRILGMSLGLTSKIFSYFCRHFQFQFLRNEIIKWKIIVREPGSLSVGQRVHIGENLIIRVDKGATAIIGDGTYLRDFCDIRVLKGGRIFIGRGSVLGVRCLIRCRKEIELGDDVRIGPDCKIIDHTHSLSLKGRTPDSYWSKPIKIGEGVGIFSNVFIGMGSNIGKFSKVSLNSVISGPIPPSCFVGGDPVKIIFPKGKKLSDLQ